MTYSIGKSFVIACLALLLTACEEPPTSKQVPPTEKKVERPVEKKASPPTDKKAETPDPALRQKREHAAVLMTIASNIGALHHCRVVGLYKSEILDDSYYRMRGVMRALKATGDPEFDEAYFVSYAAYTNSFNTGVVYTIEVPKDANPKSEFKLTGAPVNTEVACREVEGRIVTWREKGGYLDVPPDRSGIGDRT